MSQDKQRGRSRDKREEERAAYNGLVREDCPCPKTSCNRYSLCDLCRQHHLHPIKPHGLLGTPYKKTPPYCERGATK